MSKEEIVAAIRECAHELARYPTVAELKKLRQIGLRTVRRYFPSYTHALREAGFDPHGAGYRVSLEELFADWARIARLAGKIPTLADYEQHSHYSVGPLLTRFGGWTEVPRGLAQFAAERGFDQSSEWQDVLEMVHAHEAKQQGSTRPPVSRPSDEPLYGLPLARGAMAHAPTNELGVIFVFGTLAQRLGYVVTRIQTSFPDCELLRQVEPNQWQRLRAEFEFESRNFLAHRHDPAQCDLIVCWQHNWPDCPETLEVVELSTIV